MKSRNLIFATLVAALALPGMAPANPDKRVKITPTLESIWVMDHGRKVTIERAQGKEHHIPEPYAKTSRPCPPFCVQPMHIAKGVETVGELEVLGYLKRIAGGDHSVLVVDSRTPDWLARGTIPGSVNIPWNKINMDMVGTFDIGAEAAELQHILADEFGAVRGDNGWDFSKAKTLVLFCNGLWCPQSGLNLRTLLKLGYPADKLKWYRGGMQDWVSLGLTTVKR
jgi:rhodanese-related sulfurtransferase